MSKIYRKHIDDLGRIQIPKELRNRLNYDPEEFNPVSMTELIDNVLIIITPYDIQDSTPLEIIKSIYHDKFIYQMSPDVFLIELDINKSSTNDLNRVNKNIREVLDSAGFSHIKIITMTKPSSMDVLLVDKFSAINQINKYIEELELIRNHLQNSIDISNA